MSKSQKTKVHKKVESHKGKRQSITQMMYKLFKEVGVDKVLYDNALKLAKQIKPDTKFDKTHFAWYKTQYNKWLNNSP